MIENELKELGISSENLGTSTGNTWFGEGDELSSYSPVDGKLIGKVKSSPGNYLTVGTLFDLYNVFKLIITKGIKNNGSKIFTTR